MRDMEKLLHYVWKHRLFPEVPLVTDGGDSVEIIDPGLHNTDAGPDFFNAKVRVGGTLWAGNVEIHERASDWFRHGHERDAAYDNVVLHVTATADEPVHTLSGRRLPQVELEVPRAVLDNYRELLEEENYPPCYRVVPHVPALTVHGWLAALTAERLEEKTQRIGQWLERTAGDWERVCFVALARSFGFGVNAEAFEEWAFAMPLQVAGKHRDDAFQIEALFFGQAGFLDDAAVPEDRRDDYFVRLQGEYAYLAHKFSLQPMDRRRWRFLRLRPGNFPHIRLAQLVNLYHTRRMDFSRLLAAGDAAALRALFAAGVTPYWETHHAFGSSASEAQKKVPGDTSLDLVLINAVAPLLFAYGRYRCDESRCDQAVALLEQTRAERNFITRSWERAGVCAAHAADSQALYRLHRAYCERKDCLRCRFGCEYLRQRRAGGTPAY